MKGDSVQNAKIRHTSGHKPVRKSKDPDYLTVKENANMLNALKKWVPKSKRENNPNNT